MHNNGPCGCHLCLIGRRRGREKTRGAGGENAPKTCENCLGIIARGVKHPCTRAAKRSNLTGLLKCSSKKSKSKVTASALKGMDCL